MPLVSGPIAHFALQIPGQHGFGSWNLIVRVERPRSCLGASGGEAVPSCLHETVELSVIELLEDSLLVEEETWRCSIIR